jgi:alpha-L-fucosidase
MEWSVIPLPQSPETFIWPDMHGEDLGSRSKLTPGSHLWWYPAEVNLPILYGWFWAPKKACRTGLDLINTYYQSVGRNGIWLLNLSPDDRGLIPDDQLTNLRLMSRAIRETFAKNLALGGELTADSSNPGNSPSAALDGNLDTWWEAAPGKSTAALTLKLPAPVEFDVVSLQEAVDHRGQRVESFDVDAWDGLQWKLLETTEERTTIGFKRLMRLKTPVRTVRVRIRITGSRIEPTLAEVGLFKQAELINPPVISERDANGLVTIKDPRGFPVVYTTDGTTPSVKSPRYQGTLDLSRGGTVSAASVTTDGGLSLIATKGFSGLAPRGWKVIAVDSEETAAANNSASNAIDDDSNTIWHTRWAGDEPLPHSLTVDMGQEIRIAGLTYIPRSDNLNGVVDTYRFETSIDGKNWTTNINQGKFNNIQNNPIMQEVPFTPVTARYFRFTALKEVYGRNWTSAAEISVIPAK